MINLTEKQKRFADYYIKYNNATEAYISAGYKASNNNVAAVEGFKLLKNPKIKEYIETVIENNDNERIASRDEILEYYTRVVRGEETDEISFNDPKLGIIKTEQRVDTKTRLAAARELAKRYGLDKVESCEENTNEIKITLVRPVDERGE